MRTAILSVGLAAALLFAGSAFLQAAEGGELDSSEFEATLEGLTPDEKDAMREAYREFAGATTGTERPTTEGSGRVTPELIGPPIEIGNLPQNLTPQERALMGEANALEQNLQQQGFNQEQIQQQVEQQFGERFQEIHPSEGDFRSGQPGERDDLRLRELYEAGAPVGEALEHRDQGQGQRDSGQLERETLERGFSRDSMERGSFEQEHHSMEFERSGGEHSSREVEHGGSDRPEIERPSETERPSLERELERPTMELDRPELERPTTELERQEHERPTAEPTERPAVELERPEYERPTMEYQPPQS